MTFRTADALLLGIVERLEHETLGPETRQRLKAWFVQEVRHSAQFTSFLVVDSDGKLIVGSDDQKVPGNFSDREFFTYHRAHDDEKRFTSALRYGAA